MLIRRVSYEYLSRVISVEGLLTWKVVAERGAEDEDEEKDA